MRAGWDIGKTTYSARDIIFPSVLLIVTPIFDIVGALTGNFVWSLVAFWCCFAGTVLAAVTWLPMLVDFLALPRGCEARRSFRAPLWTQAVAIFAFALSTWLRLDHNKSAAALTADGGALAIVLAALAFPVSTRAAARAGRWRSAT